MMKNENSSRSLKQSNRVAILDKFRKSAEISIAELAHEVMLSKPTIKKVIDHYIQVGLVKVAGKGLSTEEGGKRPVLYKFNEDYSCVISLHLGPDFVNSAMLNFKGEITHSEFVTLWDGVSFTEVLDILVCHIEELLSYKSHSGIPVNSIVVALPGISDPEKGVLRHSPHFLSWGSDLDFKVAIENKVGREVPVYIDNVNRYQAFVEMIEGKAVGVNNFAIIDALEEGVGSGIIIDGKISHGSQNIAGEIGHCIVNTYDGCKCICGGRGCFEAEMSWRNIRRLIERGREYFPDSVLFTVGDLSVEKLFTAVEFSDTLALEIMDKLTTYFARGINNLIMVSDPELIIIQGIYNQAGESFVNAVKKKVDSMALLSMNRDAKICFSDFGMERGVRGAGLYSISNFFKQDSIYR